MVLTTPLVQPATFSVSKSSKETTIASDRRFESQTARTEGISDRLGGTVGLRDGVTEGLRLGGTLDAIDGDKLGSALGAMEGDLVGNNDGCSDVDGMGEGPVDGDGLFEGVALKTMLGVKLGAVLGASEGANDGTSDGLALK